MKLTAIFIYVHADKSSEELICKHNGDKALILDRRHLVSGFKLIKPQSNVAYRFATKYNPCCPRGGANSKFTATPTRPTTLVRPQEEIT
jgi:hypothetical protein